MSYLNSNHFLDDSPLGMIFRLWENIYVLSKTEEKCFFFSLLKTQVFIKQCITKIMGVNKYIKAENSTRTEIRSNFSFT